LSRKCVGLVSGHRREQPAGRDPDPDSATSPEPPLVTTAARAKPVRSFLDRVRLGRAVLVGSDAGVLADPPPHPTDTWAPAGPCEEKLGRAAHREGELAAIAAYPKLRAQTFISIAASIDAGITTCAGRPS
jgi:hypothetical protein